MSMANTSPNGREPNMTYIPAACVGLVLGVGGCGRGGGGGGDHHFGDFVLQWNIGFNFMYSVYNLELYIIIFPRF